MPKKIKGIEVSHNNPDYTEEAPSSSNPSPEHEERVVETPPAQPAEPKETPSEGDHRDPTKGNDDLNVDDVIGDLRKELGFFPEKPKEEPKETKEPEAPETKSQPEEEPKEPEAPNPEPKEPKTKEPQSEQEEELGYSTIAEEAARRALEHSRQQQVQTPSQPEGPDLESLAPKGRHNYEVFQKLEGLDPSRFKGVSNRYLKFIDKEEEYRRQWQKDNPDEEFNPEDSEHQDFYNRHQPKVDPHEFRRAEWDVHIDQRLAEREKAYEEKISKLESQVAEQKMGKTIEESASKAVGQLVEHVNPEMAKMLSEKTPDEVSQAYPVEFAILDEQASKARVLASEIEKLSAPGNLFKYDESNPAHQAINTLVTEKTKELRSKPRSAQVRHGKIFAPANELRTMSPQQKELHWTWEWNDIKSMVVEELANEAKTRIEQENHRFENYLKARGLSGAKPQHKPESNKEPAAPPNNRKPHSPPAQSEPASGPPGSPSEGTPQTLGQRFAQELWPQ